MTLSARLKAKTAATHAQLDALPFFQALHRGTVPALSVVSLLRAAAIIHAVFERELSRVADPDIAALGRLAVPKTPLLVADLEILQTETVVSIGDAIQVAVDAAADIVAEGDNPLKLLGILYVVEGSQNGGLALRQAYGRGLQLPPERLSYFGCYGKGTAAHWRAFVARLDSLVIDSEQSSAVADSALTCFQWFEQICAALYPYSDDRLRYHSAAINFEAGDHAMPQNPHEVALALRAGKAAWDKYPYLDRRFAQRGRRFTSSDSCWLVALARMPVDSATKNLRWLRTVLASRGIPTVILAAHLGAISDALAEAFPGQATLRAPFDRFLASLDAERHSLPGGPMISTLVDEFDRRLDACAGPVVPSAAQLVASAWVDQQSGIAGSLAATRDWFTDPARFSPDWILHVNDLVTHLDRAGGVPC